MTRRSSIFFSFASLSFVAVLAGCGGSSPNDAFLPPPAITEADAGRSQPPAPPAAVIRIATTGVPTTDEAGGRATFTVTLSAKPTSEVVVPITSPTVTEIEVEPSALTFGPNDWDQPKTVSLAGQNEDVDDGDQKVLIGVGPSTSADAAWNGVKTEGVEALNKDDDVAGIDVSTPTPSSTTTEAGTKATFTVRLKSRPAAPVTIGVTSSVIAEGTVDKAQLVFDTNDWSTPQTVTVTGQDDAVADQDEAFDVDLAKPVSSDPAYAALSATKLAFLNLDDDIPGFFVFAPALADRFTTEAGGTRSFSVRLRSKPTADVTIPLSSTKTGEGALEGVTQLVFTPANFDQVQTVTVKGVDDKVDDGDQAYAITLAAATSTDASYQGKDAPDVDLTNRDDDTAAVLVSAPTAALTTEGGTSVTFTVKLGSEPTAPVTLSLASSKPLEGTPDKTELVFDAGNWTQEQTVTVKGEDDLVDDGDVAYTIQIAHKTGSVTTDAKYAAIDPSDVNLTNSDDDTQGVTVSGPNNGTQTTEGGASVTFDVVLKTKPTGDVTMPVSISNGEATTNKTQLVFTETNWNQIQTVTIKGADDSVQDGDRDFDVVFGTATGGGYNINPPDVTLKNVDDDIAAIEQSTLSGALTEAGGQVKFKVRLATRPSGMNQVVVPIAVTAGNATRSPTSLTFTTANWDQEQEVTITGGGDGTPASTAPSVSVTVGPATSGDANYSGKSSAGYSNITNASACGIGGVNATDGEECDDENGTKCDGCEGCLEQSWATLAGTGTITVPQAALTAAGTEVCHEAWVRTGTSADATVFAMTGDDVTELSYTLECKTDKTIRLSWWDPVGFTQNDTQSFECADGKWHHIGVCLEVGLTAVKLSAWLDGAQVIGVTPSATHTVLADVKMGPLDGAVDELHVFSGTRAAFTPARHPAVVNGKTVALWRFNEGAGATASSLPANTYPIANSGWAVDTGYTTAMCQ